MGAELVASLERAGLVVTFVGFRLEPAHGDEKSLEHNPGMPNAYAASYGIPRTAPCPKRAKGTLKYVLMDPEWHLALGQFGLLTRM
ncbi:hypothetical protein GPECTOR_41g708 [Gonium pectorale]|uniref:Uncharacterized protein n=1 Tax=Gonium pectorale TaxID=33097 RepID=A0A150GAE7_GONPE|nr:hypothetical protein GPECTOR_41g708 [Gonium pectorale]|eukprot:KXZ46743.1 hypothetical protein GPECTOR_41g708 [Gonium pectorale]